MRETTGLTEPPEPGSLAVAQRLAGVRDRIRSLADRTEELGRRLVVEDSQRGPSAAGNGTNGA